MLLSFVAKHLLQLHIAADNSQATACGHQTNTCCITRMLPLSPSHCPVCATEQASGLPFTCDTILHVLQDVAIAYGYNNVGLSVPPTVTVGKELPLNQLVELLRLDCAMCGFSEILTWALCSRAENFDYLRRQDDGKTAVSIGNPATAEFEVCRTSLLQGEALSDC